MDVQRGIVERFTGAGVFLARLAGSIEGARGVGIPLIFLRVAFRAG
jgi:hypothetical protein